MPGGAAEDLERAAILRSQHQGGASAGRHFGQAPGVAVYEEAAFGVVNVGEVPGAVAAQEAPHEGVGPPGGGGDRPGGVALNAFLKRLERQRGGFRLPLPLPAGPMLAAGKLARHTPLRGLGEKITTFLYKDDRRLAALPPPPGLTFDETDAFLAAGG